MTPFGIRKRIKVLLGGDGNAKRSTPSRPDLPKITITLTDGEGNEETVQAAAGSSVAFATANMARPLATGCSDATCATCRVEIVAGAENITPQSEGERKCLEENKHPAALRLGCQAEIRQGVVTIRGHEFVE